MVLFVKVADFVPYTFSETNPPKMVQKAGIGGFRFRAKIYKQRVYAVREPKFCGASELDRRDLDVEEFNSLEIWCCLFFRPSV